MILLTSLYYTFPNVVRIQIIHLLSIAILFIVFYKVLEIQCIYLYKEVNPTSCYTFTRLCIQCNVCHYIKKVLLLFAIA